MLNQNIQQLFSELGTPNLSMDPSAGIKINRFPEEILLAQAQPQTVVPQANQPGYGYQIGQQVGGPEFNVQTQSIPVQEYAEQPSSDNENSLEVPPVEEPVTTPPAQRTGVAQQYYLETLEKLAQGIPDAELKRRIEFQKVLDAQELEVEKLRAQTAVEKRKIDENIARYQANAIREAEIAKALTLVAYKANRPDAELVGQIMGPTSGLSSLYKAVGPVQGANIQLPRRN